MSSTFYQQKTLEDIKYNLKSKLFGSYLKQDYSFFLKTNTSQLLRNNSNECEYAVFTLFSIITIWSEVLVAMGTPHEDSTSGIQTGTGSILYPTPV